MSILGIVLLFPHSSLVAQVSSRAAEIEAARDEKAQHLEPDEVTGAEATLRYIKDRKVLERISAGIAGFRVKLGGMVTGGGFALGPEYLRRDLADGEVVFRAAAQSSFKNYQKYDLQLTFPAFARNRLFFDLNSVHHRYPGINYYGPGPDSLKSSRSNFLFEDTGFDGVFGLRPFKHMELGVSGGYLLVNVGPGGDQRFVSVEQVFSPVETPGIDAQANFLRFGAFMQFDYRDNPGGPRSGGNYSVQFNGYLDRTLDRHDFRRLDLEVQQYIPFLNKRRVFALRGKSVLTFKNWDQTVPFYLQPVLGGSDDLRGFRSFRFYDDNLILANFEYRWETFAGLEMALFWDGGKVFPRHSQWNFRDMESSAGFGFRFNVANNVFLRIDTGFSHEGFQIWFKFSDVFGRMPNRYSSPY